MIGAIIFTVVLGFVVLVEVSFFSKYLYNCNLKVVKLSKEVEKYTTVFSSIYAQIESQFLQKFNNQAAQLEKELKTINERIAEMSIKAKWQEESNWLEMKNQAVEALKKIGLTIVDVTSDVSEGTWKIDLKAIDEN